MNHGDIFAAHKPGTELRRFGYMLNIMEYVPCTELCFRIVDRMYQNYCES